ncbi:TIGR03960 family B12-binding radical SAM protein [Acidaminococcus sp.]|uniref:TIGR03960 family B12-binding radical SAM protein n=1 Tax=Acidaminococcus sp. TaxID=1872103 RepID=UPI003D7E9AD6
MHKDFPIDILSAVEKPARYTGMEFGSIVKPETETEVSFCLAFPDTYEIGMSYLGYKILYEILNKLPKVAAERAFAPWVDMEEKMRERKLPLTSLENSRKLDDFDLLGFTLLYEMSYSNILNMMDLGGVPVLAKDRTLDDPFVCAGGCCVFNSEPLTDFLDFCMLGDGERIIQEVTLLYRDWKREGKPGGRLEFLRRVSKIQGVYVPCFYEVTYGSDGTITGKKSLEPTAPAVVYKRAEPDLETLDFPTHPIVPYSDTVHDRIMLELFRGCSRGCRFCNAGIIYRPVRERKPQTAMELARKLVPATGYNEISLFSLSTADYSHLEPLILNLLKEFGDKKVSVSLPSLRIDSFSVKLAQEVQQVRKSGLTFAPEAGSQRMRDVINKGVTEENLMNAAGAAFENGWTKVKLYFMIGLPTETDEDVLAIAKLAQKVQWKYKQVTGHMGAQVTVSVSNFVPKPYTPFQWVGQNTKEEFDRKHMLLKHAFASLKNIHYQYHDSRTSLMEGVLARGDRRLGKAIYLAWKRGAKFDSWGEFFDYDRWKQAIEDCGLTTDFYNSRPRGKEEIFPWEHTSCGVSRRFLWSEYEKAQQAALTHDCRRSTCTGCGVCQQLGIKIIDWKGKNV